MGWAGVARQIGTLLRRFLEIENGILQSGAEAVVLIDNPSFNLRLARSLRRKGYAGRLIQYICPKVWVHGRGRIATMAQTLDLLLAIHPFEPPLFADTRLPTHYVGHPLVAQLRDQRPSPERTSIALFPGSRPSVVMANLPVQLQAASPWRDRLVISVAHPQLQPLVEQLAPGIPTSSNARQLMTSAQAALATCGTVTLELALCQVPTAVTYKVHPFDRFICRHFLHLTNNRHYALPNIIAQKSVFPEFIESRLNVAAIGRTLHHLLDGPQRRSALEGCQEIIDQLGTRDASQEAARHILKMLPQ
jgi:lipid-A-disaccharide synthase